MSIFVDTSDKRNQFVLFYLLEKNIDAKVYLENCNKVKSGDIIVFSPAKKILYEEIINFCEKITIYCGNLSEEFLQILNSKKIIVKNLLQDEAFAIKNAILTAEGVLSLIIENTQKSLQELSVLFLGGGRITKASAILLKKLGVNVEIASFNENDYGLAHFYSDRAYFKDSFISNLNKFDVIVNTRPFCYINEESINKINENTLFIETASVKCIAEKERVKFNYLLAPALPQRFACKSAGKIIADKILGELND